MTLMKTKPKKTHLCTEGTHKLCPEMSAVNVTGAGSHQSVLGHLQD